MSPSTTSSRTARTIAEAALGVARNTKMMANRATALIRSAVWCWYVQEPTGPGAQPGPLAAGP